MLKRFFLALPLFLTIDTLTSDSEKETGSPIVPFTSSPSIAIRSKSKLSSDVQTSALHIRLMKQGSCDVEKKDTFKKRIEAFESVFKKTLEKKAQQKAPLSDDDLFFEMDE